MVLINLQQLATFFAAIYDLYALAGGKLVSKEILEQRFKICSTCEHFTGRACELCGCCSNKKKNLFNKLAYPTQECPDKPPRWPKIQG